MKRLYNYDVGTVLSYGIICYSLLEIAWFQIFHDVITYDFQVNDLFIEYKDIDDDIINSKSQIFLQKLIFIAYSNFFLFWFNFIFDRENSVYY